MGISNSVQLGGRASHLTRCVLTAGKASQSGATVNAGKVNAGHSHFPAAVFVRIFPRFGPDSAFEKPL